MNCLVNEIFECKQIVSSNYSKVLFSFVLANFRALVQLMALKMVGGEETNFDSEREEISKALAKDIARFLIYYFAAISYFFQKRIFVYTYTYTDNSETIFSAIFFFFLFYFFFFKYFFTNENLNLFKYGGH